MNSVSTSAAPPDMPLTRGYQQEMLDDSLRRNIIIALDTGSGKTHIAVLRLRYEMDREPRKISWFFAPTVALCEQQKSVLKAHLPVSVGLISGSNEPNQWKNATLWADVLRTHRAMVSTPQVFLDALRHGYISLGQDISLIVFDEAHHAVDNHPYNRIMMEFYFALPVRTSFNTSENVRPMILGLTASPIYGGDVVKAFQNIENNLDCTIRAPVQHRSELARYVHRPRFKHVMYQPSDPNTSFSTNLASLVSVISTIDIENDPYVISLRSQFATLGRESFEYKRIDQKLSKVVSKEDSFTHKGLRDFQRAAEDICQDIGAWAADWFVWKVVERAKEAANPFNNMMVTWKRTEKAYLLGILNQVIAVPASYYPDDIADDLADKVEVLIDCLLMEKGEAESLDETYSVIIFVQRRDTVLALAEVLNHHPLTKDVFRIGVLLGTSESSHRHAMMDITRILLRDPQDETIADFKTGDKNLIVSTSVAEEGIDIQACGSVIRWDPPMNMASWVQSRGRARKERSSFTVMFEKGSAHQASVAKWEDLEKQMVALYNNPSRQPAPAPEEVDVDEDMEDNDIEFQVESTGALLTLHSAVSHLMHFCAVIPNSTHAINQPYYAVDPPEFPEGWHAFAGGRMQPRLPYTGPYGSRVTLPRSLPLPERHFSVDCVYKNIISAHRHSAFKAYKALYDAGLLNENLLPITSVLEPELEEEVKAMLADVEKREGLAKVSMSINPWLPTDAGSEEVADSWHQSRLYIGDLPPLFLFTRSAFIKLDAVNGPLLYRAGIPPIGTSIEYVGRATLRDTDLRKARNYTRVIFWSLNNTRMEWNNLDFSYLILPVGNGDQEWDARRSWLSNISNADSTANPYPLMVRANELGVQFGYPSDLTLIQRQIGAGSPFKFVRWQYEPVSEEEEEAIRERYKHVMDLEITYPLLVVEKFPPRSNFLIPTPPPKENGMDTPANKPPATIHFIPRLSSVVLLSPEESEYAFLLPSILRFLSMSITANSLRNTVFTESPISVIPLSLLVTAITAPSSGERLNYQRMETLGDTVLKFMTGIQLMAEYPLWHEGYLTRKKDHAVSNVRLAKEDIKRGLYRWIIRDNMLGKKWKPHYFTVHEEPNSPVSSDPPQQLELVEALPKKKSKKKQELSTKVLADVVESIIGAAYLHGGFSLGYECTKYFDLGLKWEPIPARVDQLLSRVEQLTEQEVENFPPQLFDVEKMLGYTFRQKLLLVEALTHASYQSDSRTPSYERMEFLGDSVLDMVVTDYLYHAPGKNYSPGHMHLRKSAVVNGHILAYICLKTQLRVKAVMPRPDANGQIEVTSDAQDMFLWKCLLHSSHKVLEDQQNTFARFRKRRDEIEDSLMKGTIFPWAALTRLQAPKFFSDMMESIIGAAFLDCGGSISVVRDILVRLGIMPLLEHIVLDNVDVLHPVSRLSMWAQKHDKEIQYDSRHVEGKAICTILVDGKEEITVSDEWRGKPSQDEVKFAAAEMAIKQFKLRNDGVSYDVLKKKKASKPKKKKQKQKQKQKQKKDS